MKPGRAYWCIRCKQSNIFKVGTLHEIFYGIGIKPIAIKHHIQAPLCAKCHRKVHSDKEPYQIYLCEVMEMNFYAIRDVFNITRDYADAFGPDDHYRKTKIQELIAYPME